MLLSIRISLDFKFNLVRDGCQALLFNEIAKYEQALGIVVPSALRTSCSM